MFVVVRKTAVWAGLVLGVAVAAGADWPQYRGPGRDGAAPAAGLARAWPAAGPKVVWKRPIGSGFSQLLVAGGRLYTMAAADGQEYVLALDPESGAELWRVAMGPAIADEFGDGPRSTPTIEGGVLYALSSQGRLAAIDLAQRSALWELQLTEGPGASVPRFGYSTSPLVDGEQLIVDVGAGAGKKFFAFDRQSGEVRWTALDGGAGHCSPILVTVDGAKQYVAVEGQRVLALSPAGALVWEYAWAAGTIAMPLFVPPDRVFVSAADDAGAVLLRIRRDGVEELWRNRSMKNHFNASVALGGNVYGFDNASLKCVALAGGEPCWTRRGLGKGSLVAGDGLLVVLGDTGQLVLAEATAEAYRQLGEFQALAGKSWTAPSLVGRRLYLRNLTEMACIDLGS